MLWCTICTNVFKTVTNRFIKNLACSGICASLVCVPFDVALGASPRCCWWLHMLMFCKSIKFLHRLFCSVTVLSFSAIALDRSVLLEFYVSAIISLSVCPLFYLLSISFSPSIWCLTTIAFTFAQGSAYYCKVFTPLLSRSYSLVAKVVPQWISVSCWARRKPQRQLDGTCRPVRIRGKERQSRGGPEVRPAKT